MIRKIKYFFRWMKVKLTPTDPRQFDDFPSEDQMYTKEQLNLAYKLGYNDGKRDGLAVAREQASRSMSEILKQQNKE